MNYTTANGDTMNGEEWRSVVGFPRYEVSNMGRVRRATPEQPSVDWLDPARASCLIGGVRYTRAEGCEERWAIQNGKHVRTDGRMRTRDDVEEILRKYGGGGPVRILVLSEPSCRCGHPRSVHSYLHDGWCMVSGQESDDSNFPRRTSCGCEGFVPVDQHTEGGET